MADPQITWTTSDLKWKEGENTHLQLKYISLYSIDLRVQISKHHHIAYPEYQLDNGQVQHSQVQHDKVQHGQVQHGQVQHSQEQHDQ